MSELRTFEKSKVYRNWNIKLNIPPVYIGCVKVADRVSTSIGIPYMKKLVGKKRTEKILMELSESKLDKEVVKLRSGGKITFYSK